MAKEPLVPEPLQPLGPLGPDQPPARASRVGVLRPLAIPDFRRLWTGLTVSLLGDGIFFVAIAWQIYDGLGASPAAFSLVSISWSLPLLLFVLLGGVASDRFDRRHVMIAADVLRGVAVAGMGLLTVLEVVQVWHLAALAVLFGIGQALFGPAFGSIVPDIVPKDLLLEANSLDNFVRPGAQRLVGPALGGFLVAAIGAGPAFLVDAASFAFAGVMVAFIRTRPKHLHADKRSLKRELAEGFAFVRRTPWLFATLLAAGASLLFAMGPFQILLPYLVKTKLGGGAHDVGFTFAAGGVGAVTAALLMGQWGLPRRHITFLYVTWAIAFGSLGVYSVATELWQVFLTEFAAWLLITAGLIVWGTLMHTLVPSRLLGRVTSLDWLVSTSLVPVSFAIAGPASTAFGLEETFAVAGILGGGTVLLFLFFPGVRDTERSGIHASEDPSEAP